MSHWRRLHYSASTAVIVTALAVFFGGMFGELVLVPGLILQGVSEVILTELLTRGDNFYFLPPGSHAVLTAAVYSSAAYVISFGWGAVKEGAKGR